MGMAASARQNTDGGGLTAPISFDIEAQPLEAALDAFGSATGIQVLYEASLAAGRRSTKVEGRFTPDIALGTLLIGTGLTARYTTDDAYTIVRKLPAADLAGKARLYAPPDFARYGHYLGLAQAGILDVLCRSAETRPGGYRLTLKFWIGPSGAIQKTALLDSTGNSSRDSAILGALEDTAVAAPPPADMPQPVTMMIARRSPDETGDCAP
ncbi:MAG: TonB family protein [Pseudomonadota bacterium]